MRRFLLGVFTGILTLAVVLGGAFLLAKREPKPEEPVVQTETAMETAAETTQAVPEETLTLVTLPPVTVPAAIGYATVPSYFQTDYPHINFGNGTMATSGCSVTCLAMVASYLTDQEYTPVQMAYHFGNYGKTNIERLDYGIAQMQLPYVRTEDIQDVLKAVSNGKVVIVMMDDESIFTTEQHFIVLTGMTKDGKILVNDPLEPNYTATVYLKNAFANGFEDFDLMRGFSGGWIFDKKEMASVSFRFDASMPEQQENRYEGYTLTEEDIYTLACFAWAEGREEPQEVQQAMVEVVLNRLVSPDYPNTVQGILKKTELYRATKAMARVDEPELEQYLAVNAAMYGPYILPEDICFYSDWEKGEDIWGQLGSFTFARSR